MYLPSSGSCNFSKFYQLTELIMNKGTDYFEGEKPVRAFALTREGRMRNTRGGPGGRRSLRKIGKAGCLGNPLVDVVYVDQVIIYGKTKERHWRLGLGFVNDIGAMFFNGFGTDTEELGNLLVASPPQNHL